MSPLLIGLVGFSVLLLLIRWLYPPLWQIWLRLVQPIGDFMARLLLMVFYLLFTWPFALVLRRQRPQTFGRHSGSSYWEPNRGLEHTLENAQQQF